MSTPKVTVTVAAPSELEAEPNRPYVIAGPCSAESEQQVLEAARQVSTMPQVKAFRAGVWKPRTRPNSFEGVGHDALKWLQRAKAETGLSIAVEVANVRHVEAALEHDVDIVWIGARTTTNPFSVQEIADALRGADLRVWVKNPVNPDLQLWLGALERMDKAGLKQLGAIHRGFTVEEKMVYRNAPKWEIAIELRRLVPNLPMLCDPSHIAGRRDVLQMLSQKALDLAMTGLMIEVHPEPEKAKSDAEQQIRPAELRELLASLQIRHETAANPGGSNRLEALRRQSNAIDYELLETLARRMQVVTEIGSYKKEHNLTILQVKRWQELLADRLQKAADLGLDTTLIRDIYELLHKHAISLQSEVMNEKPADVS